jgi:hypothetical protein
MEKQTNDNPCPVEMAAGDLAQPVDWAAVRKIRTDILIGVIYPVPETHIDDDYLEEITE